MSSVAIANLAVALEIISFFCVTLDLYGPERLAAFDIRVKRALQWVREQKPAYVLGSMLIWLIQGAIEPLLNKDKGLGSRGCKDWITYPVFLGLMFLVYATMPELQKLGWLGLPVTFIFMILFAALIVLLVVFASWILEFVIDGIVSFAMILLVKWKLSGFLLFFGTVLFLTSKILSVQLTGF